MTLTMYWDVVHVHRGTSFDRRTRGPSGVTSTYITFSCHWNRHRLTSLIKYSVNVHGYWGIAWIEVDILLSFDGNVPVPHANA